MTRENKLENIWARGRKKRRGVFKRALPKNKKRLCMSGRRLLPADAGGG
nr:MAG TPA: hypothetical protein [Caudoviricetes sp.]